MLMLKPLKVFVIININLAKTFFLSHAAFKYIGFLFNIFALFHTSLINTLNNYLLVILIKKKIFLMTASLLSTLCILYFV